MAGPSWVAGTLAAVMLVTAAYCAGRLALSRRCRRETEFDADGTHVLMGTAMAGMLVSRLNPLPVTMWEAVFTGAAGWFAWQAIRTRGGHPPGRWQSHHPVPHLIESAAMLYMLHVVPSSSLADQSPAGTTMPGMSGSPGAAGEFPALAVVLALFMVSYVVWAADQLTSLVRARTAQNAAAPPRTFATVAASGTRDYEAAAGTRGAAATWHQPGAIPMLAPRLAACYKITMGITMGYMLILML